MKIGIVSGIGPLAGADVLAKTFKVAAHDYGAVEDHEYPDLVLVNHGIEGVDSTGALQEAFEKDLRAMIAQLENQEASVIGIACNTAHLYLKKIKTKPETQLVNLIDEVAAEAAKSDISYLLLTSSVSKTHKLYHGYLEERGVTFRETNQEQQALLDEAIGLVMAHRLGDAGALLDRVMKSAYWSGFGAVIAACTELPIALAHAKKTYGLGIIDSNTVLAGALTARYYPSVRKLAP